MEVTEPGETEQAFSSFASAAASPADADAPSPAVTSRPVRSTRSKKVVREGEDEKAGEEDGEEDGGVQPARASAPQTAPRKRGRSTAGESSSDESSSEEAAATTVQWVQCDACQKWRKAPADITATLPDSWRCSQNTWDSLHASCDAPEEGQHEDEEVWPGLPAAFLESREREDFYFTISRALFSSSTHAVPYPSIHAKPVDLYAVYLHTAIHPFQHGLEYWQHAAKLLGFPVTEYSAQKLRHSYKKSHGTDTSPPRTTPLPPL